MVHGKRCPALAIVIATGALVFGQVPVPEVIYVRGILLARLAANARIRFDRGDLASGRFGNAPLGAPNHGIRQQGAEFLARAVKKTPLGAGVGGAGGVIAWYQQFSPTMANMLAHSAPERKSAAVGSLALPAYSMPRPCVSTSSPTVPDRFYL